MPKSSSEVDDATWHAHAPEERTKILAADNFYQLLIISGIKISSELTNPTLRKNIGTDPFYISSIMFSLSKSEVWKSQTGTGGSLYMVAIIAHPTSVPAAKLSRINVMCW
jgi:hypothetical protein